MSGKRLATSAHGSHAQITLFGAGLTESQQTEADAQIRRVGALWRGCRAPGHRLICRSDAGTKPSNMTA